MKLMRAEARYGDIDELAGAAKSNKFFAVAIGLQMPALSVFTDV
jgi:hypothetical protein